MFDRTLIRKYDIPGPRYTSYPTVPYWDEHTFSVNNWENELNQIDGLEGVSLYIHLPYCESLCTYCGCNTRITKNHKVELPYIQSLLKEWDLYKKAIGYAPVIKEVHLGGGTPTFFSPENLHYLLDRLLKDSVTDPPEISVEAHPNSTKEEHLQILYDLGSRRVSFGIQDFDLEVQRRINRIQSYEKVQKITESARKTGYQSINYDIIFGLPHQNKKTISDTIRKVVKLRPDRIAFYSYAHVPWLKPAQRSYEQYLPQKEEKRVLYEIGKNLLENNNYLEIGMDHFALPSDDLYKALENESLHRNFMGYTTQTTRYVIGLGVSAISDLWTAFAQNEKTVDAYQHKLEKGEFPVFRGHVLNNEDLLIRKHILDLMCKHRTDLSGSPVYVEKLKERLEEMEKDGLIIWKKNTLYITQKGSPYSRNVCMAFDLRMLKNKPESQLFSQTV